MILSRASLNPETLEGTLESLQGSLLEPFQEPLNPKPWSALKEPSRSASVTLNPKPLNPTPLNPKPLKP